MNKAIFDVLKIEAEAIMGLSNNYIDDFDKIVNLIFNSNGRVVATGVGKSGLIGKKIAATLASTGTPSFFMHPTEALHGDLGALTSDDIVIAISNSGECEEIIRLILSFKQGNVGLVVMTGNIESTMAKESDYLLDISIEREACPLQLAPMASSAATLAMGDALAVALMKKRKFKPVDFALRHPGGNLGKKLLKKVEDVMITDRLPVASPDMTFVDTMEIITNHKLGLAIIINSNNNIVGIITDGDIRRGLESSDKSRFDILTKEVMTKHPMTISPETTVIEAERIMLDNKISVLIVSKNEKPVGVVQLLGIGLL